MNASRQESTWKFPSLPKTLMYLHNVKQEVPLYQAERFRYQYNLISTSACPLLIQNLSRSFYHTYRKEKIHIPATIVDNFCRHCHTFLVPGITCTQRLRPRSSRSKVNTHSKPSMKNELIFHCLQCDKTAKAKHGFNSTTKKSKNDPSCAEGRITTTKPTSTTATDGSNKSSSIISGTGSSKSASQQQNRYNNPQSVKSSNFSFLNKNSSNNSSSNSSNKGNVGGFSFLKNQHHQQQTQSKSFVFSSGLSGDFIPLPNSANNSNNNGAKGKFPANSKGNGNYNNPWKFSGQSPLQPPLKQVAESEGAVNLLDAIEKQKKLEKRRKSS